MLNETEEKWAPADDPVFELMPPPFQDIVDRCYDDLGYSIVTVKSFWTVYCTLHDKVDAILPLTVITSFNQSILSEPGEGENPPFSLADLEAPRLNMKNVIDADEIYVDEDEEGLFSASFTVDNDQDQLYWLFCLE